jgi:hypothetical protein
MAKNLSKSQYTKGLQCAKALWLYRHRKDLASERDAFQESIMEAGTEFGILARKRWPGGVLITADHLHPEDALAQTKAALEAGANTLYEAAFLHEGVLVRVDVMERLGSPSAGAFWDIYEVKSGTKVEEVHLHDVVVQRFVLEGAGQKVARANVVHANGGYIRRGALDLEALFAVEDVTKETALMLAEVPAALAEMKRYADGPEAPPKPIGDHCKKPYECEFKAHCWAGIPAYSVFDIPYLKMAKKLELFNSGVQLVHQVNPDLQKITDKRSLRPILAARAGKPQVDVAAVRAWLANVVYPVAHLDFETDNPVVPPFDLLRPYSQMPFQASVRVQKEMGGEVVEHAFLGDGVKDPRHELADFLDDVTPRRGSVFAYYKPFEEGRLAELAFQGVVHPKFQKRLLDIQGRLQDLADLFRDGHYTHPGFKGRWSIKTVGPTFAPDLSYDKLDLHGGTDAISAYAELRDPKTTPARRAEVEKALKAYCGLDTELMVRILAHLYEVAK